MIIQGNIDQNDVVEARRSSRRAYASAAARLGAALVLLVFMTLYGLMGLYAAFSAFGRNVNNRFGAPFREQALGFGADIVPIFVSILMICVAALAWSFLHRVVNTLRKGHPTGWLKHGLTLGRHVIDMSETHLVVKTPLKGQKIAWAAFSDFEETKTSLIFYNADGTFEFVPKAVLPDRTDTEALCADLERRIRTPLSRSAGEEASSLRLAYELTEADYDEFRRWRRSEDGKTQRLVERLIASPRILAGVCCAFLVLAVLSLIGGGFGIGAAGFCAAAAAALALTHPHLFAVVSARLGRLRQGQFARSDPTVVTLSKAGVFRERRGTSEVYQWEAFDGLVQTKSAAYLVLGPDAALVLPKRAFADEEHYERLTTFATVRLAEAMREKTSAQMNRLQKSAASPAPKPIAQISHRSAAGRSDDSPAAPGHKPARPIRAARAQ